MHWKLQKTNGSGASRLDLKNAMKHIRKRYDGIWHHMRWVPTANPQERKWCNRRKDSECMPQVRLCNPLPLQLTPPWCSTKLQPIAICKRRQLLTLFHYRSWSRFWRLQNLCLESLNDSTAGWLGDQTTCLEAIGAFQWHVGASPLPALESKIWYRKSPMPCIFYERVIFMIKLSVNDWQFVLLISANYTSRN